MRRRCRRNSGGLWPDRTLVVVSTRPGSPRLAAVLIQRGTTRSGALRGAIEVGLCGSVARGQDRDDGEIDFFVRNFVPADGPEARLRATQLVRDFRRILAPHSVDVRGIPGYMTDPAYEASMRRDWTDLRDLAQLTADTERIAVGRTAARG